MTATASSFTRRAGRATSAALLALAVAAATAAAPALAAGDGLALSDGYIRMIIPSRPAAGYFTLSNNSDTERTLVGASSSGCGSVMLHQSIKSGNVEKMIPVKSVPVPAHGNVTFAPGGFHLMCMKPAATLTPGSTASVTLKFEDGGTLTGDFPVRGPSAN